MASKTASDGDGSFYQRHGDRYGCPPAAGRARPTHRCSAPWVGVAVVDWRDGKPVRRKVTGSSKANAKAKLRALRDKIQRGQIPSGRIPTVREWMTYWLEQVVPGRNRPSTQKSYTTYVNRYIIPLLGDVRLDRLTPEHLADAWSYLTEVGCPGKAIPKPLSSTSARQAHVIMSRALKVAQARGIITKNVASLMEDPPSIDTADMEVLTKQQADRVVEVAAHVRNTARWTVAVVLGLRQGEALGLRWQDLDLERGVLHVRHSLGRVTGQGLVLGEVKSKTGRRDIALPGPLLEAFKAHRVAQNEERLAQRQRWHDGDYVFCEIDGRPTDSKTDWERWRRLLADAEAPMVRLHAARHTAITMMLAMGIPPHIVKEIAGHAKFSTTEGYVDKVDELHLDAAQKMAAFWN